MSLMSMRRKMASKQTATMILWGLILVFLVGIALWSVPNRGAVAGGAKGPRASVVVATVNGEKITGGEIDDEFYKQNESGVANIDSALEMRKEIYKKTVQTHLLNQLLKERHIRANDSAFRKIGEGYAQMQLNDMHKAAEATAKQEAEEFAKNNQPGKETKKPRTAAAIFSENMNGFVMQNMPPNSEKPKGMNEKKFKRWFVNDFLMSKGKDGMYDRFAEHGRTRLLGASVINELPDSRPNPFSDRFQERLATMEVKASWIFIAAKTGTPAALDAAKKKATELQQQVQADPASFAKLARENSADFTSQAQGGDLGWISAEKMYFPVMGEYMAFSQNVGEVGPPTMVTMTFYQTQVGYAFMKVEKERKRTDLPKDFKWAKEREQALLKSQQRYESELGDSFLEYSRVSAKIKCISPELASYQHEIEGDFVAADKSRLEALKEKDLPKPVMAALSYKAYMTTTEGKKRTALLEAALPYAGNRESELHMQLGGAYLADKDEFGAAEQFYQASLTADKSDRRTRELARDQLAKLTKIDGVADKVKEIDDWLKDPKNKVERRSPDMSGMGTMPISVR